MNDPVSIDKLLATCKFTHGCRLLSARYAHANIQSISVDTVTEELKKVDTSLAIEMLGSTPQNAAAVNAAGVAGATAYAVIVVLSAMLSLEVATSAELLVRCIRQHDGIAGFRQCVTHNLSTALATPLTGHGKGLLPVGLMVSCLELWFNDQIAVFNTLMALSERGNKLVGHETIDDDPLLDEKTDQEILEALTGLESKGLYRVLCQRIVSCFEYFKDESKLQATVNQALSNAELTMIQCALQYRTTNPVELHKAFEANNTVKGSSGLPGIGNAGLSHNLMGAAAGGNLVQLSLPARVFEVCATHRKKLLECNLTLLASMTTCLAIQNESSLKTLICLAPHLFTISPIDFPTEQQLIGPHTREFDLMVENFYFDPKANLELFEVGHFITLIISCLLNSQYLRISQKNGKALIDRVSDDLPQYAPSKLFGEEVLEAKICRWLHGLSGATDVNTVNLFLRYVVISCHAPSSLFYQAILRVVLVTQQLMQSHESGESKSVELFKTVTSVFGTDQEQGSRIPNYDDPQILTTRAMFLDSLLRRCPQYILTVLPMCEIVLGRTANDLDSLNITGHEKFDELKSLIHALAHLYITLYSALAEFPEKRTHLEARFGQQFNRLWAPVEQLAVTTKSSPTTAALTTLSQGQDWREVLACWSWAFRAVGIGAFSNKKAICLEAALSLLSVDYHGLAERFGDNTRRDWLLGVCSCVVNALNVFNENTVSFGVDETSILRALGDRLSRIKALLWMMNKEISQQKSREANSINLFETFISGGRSSKPTETSALAELVEWKTLLMLAIVKSFLAMKGHQANMHAADTLLYLKFIDSQLLPDLAEAFELKEGEEPPSNAQSMMETQMTAGDNPPANSLQIKGNEQVQEYKHISANLWKLAALICEIIKSCVGSIPPRSPDGSAPPPRCSKPAPGAAYLATSLGSENSLWQKVLVLCCVRAFDTANSASSDLPNMVIESGIKAIYACVTREGAALALPRALHGEDASSWGCWVKSSGYDLAPHLCPSGSGWGRKLCRYEREFLWSCPNERAGEVPLRHIPLGRAPLVLDLIRWAAKQPTSNITCGYTIPILCALIARDPDPLAAVLSAHEADAKTLSYLFAKLLNTKQSDFEPEMHNGCAVMVKEIELRDSRILQQSLSSFGNNMDIWLFEQIALESIIPDALQGIPVTDNEGLSHLDTCDTFVSPFDPPTKSLLTVETMPAEIVEPFVKPINTLSYSGDSDAPRCNHPSRFPVEFVPPHIVVVRRISLLPKHPTRQRLLALILSCLDHIQQGGSTDFPWLPHPVESILGLKSLGICLTKKYLYSPEKYNEVISALCSLLEEDEGDEAVSVAQYCQVVEILTLCLYHRTCVPSGAGPAAQFPLRAVTLRNLPVRCEGFEVLLAPAFQLNNSLPQHRATLLPILTAEARLAAAEIDSYFAQDCRTCVECPEPKNCVAIAADDIELWRRMVGITQFCKQMCSVNDSTVHILLNFELSIQPLSELYDFSNAIDSQMLLTYEHMMGYLILRVVCSQLVCRSACFTKGAILESFARNIAPALAATFGKQLQSVRSSAAQTGFEFVALSCTRVALQVGIALYRYTEIFHEMVVEPGRLPAYALTTREESKTMLDLLTNCHRLVTSLVHNSELTLDYVRQALTLMLDRAALLIVEIDKEFVFRELNEASAT